MDAASHDPRRGPSTRPVVSRDDDVVVTGVGPVSAIGIGARPFWEALVAGRSGVAPITRCDVSAGASRIAAEVRGFRLADWMPRADRLYRAAPRTVQLTLAATALALDDAGLDGALAPDRIGVAVGTSLGHVAEAVEAVAACATDRESPPPHRAVTLFHHSAACMVTAAFDLCGPVVTVSTGCNSGLDALGHGLRLVQTGQADAVVAVGADAEVVPEVLAMLEAAGALTTRYNDRPEAASRPFDAGRDGNVIGEGAAALVLESGCSARRRGARIYARVAAHASRAAGRRRRYRARDPEPDPTPSVRALGGALSEARWAPDDVELRTEIEVCEKTRDGWRVVDRISPETVRFEASLLELTDGGTFESACVFRATSEKGIPYTARLAEPAKISANPASGRFDAELTFEVWYGDDTAQVPAKLTTGSVSRPVGARRSAPMRGVLGGGEATVTLVSSNVMKRSKNGPLMLVCTERYRLVPKREPTPSRSTKG